MKLTVIPYKQVNPKGVQKLIHVALQRMFMNNPSNQTYFVTTRSNFGSRLVEWCREDTAATSCCFLLLPVASYCFLLLPATPALVVCRRSKHT